MDTEDQRVQHSYRLTDFWSTASWQRAEEEAVWPEPWTSIRSCQCKGSREEGNVLKSLPPTQRWDRSQMTQEELGMNSFSFWSLGLFCCITSGTEKCPSVLVENLQQVIEGHQDFQIFRKLPGLLRTRKALPGGLWSLVLLYLFSLLMSLIPSSIVNYVNDVKNILLQKFAINTEQSKNSWWQTKLVEISSLSVSLR